MTEQQALLLVGWLAIGLIALALVCDDDCPDEFTEEETHGGFRDPH